MPSAAIARLAGPVQITPSGANQVVHTVPSGQTHVVKSIYLRNSRGDSTQITYSLYIVPSGQTFDGNVHRWIGGDVTAPGLTAGITKALDYSLLVLSPGDTVVIFASATGLYYEAHGLVIQ